MNFLYIYGIIYLNVYMYGCALYLGVPQCIHEETKLYIDTDLSLSILFEPGSLTEWGAMQTDRQA